MKKLVKFGLTALCVATLAACGSSGGSSNNNKPANHNVGTNQQSNANNTANSTTQQNNTNNAANSTQQAPTAPKAVLNANIASSGLKSGTVTASAVTVDGKTFPIAIPGLSAGKRFTNWGGSINGITSVIVKENKGSQYYGFVADTTSSQRYAYYGSNQAETSVMPTSGTASYEGDVIYSYGGKLDGDDRVADGDVHLTADFGSKKVTGTIDDVVSGAGTKLTANVNADISGNGFTGSVSTATQNAALSGKFYGTNANAMGAVFDDGRNGLAGAFTADKK